MEVRTIELPSGRFINVVHVRSLDPTRSWRMEWSTGEHELLPSNDGDALAQIMRTGVPPLSGPIAAPDPADQLKTETKRREPTRKTRSKTT